MKLLSSIQTWLVVARLPSVTLVLTSIMLGTMLAIWEGKWNISVASLSMLTGVLLQVLSNLANDYGDFFHKANVDDRVGDGKKIGLVSPPQLKQAIWLVGVLALISGLLLLVVVNLSKPDWVKFGLLGMIAIVAAVAYTMGPQPYGYLGFGDLAVWLFFGLVGVLGTAYLHTKTCHLIYILPAASCGCLAVAVLNINNIRDQALDQAVGKNTLVVRMGKKGAIYYQWMLLSLSVLLLVVFTEVYYQSPCQWIFLIVVPRLLQNGWMTQQLPTGQLDRILQKLVTNQFLLLLLFGLGLVLSKYW